MKKVLLAMSVAALLVGCKNEKGNVTEGGFEYTVKHSNPNGQKANNGDYIMFDATMTLDGEKVLRKSGKGLNQPIVKLDREDKTATKDPILQVFKDTDIKVGDSLEVTVPLDSLPQARTAFKDGNNFIYKIYIDSILNEEQHNALKEERRVEMEEMRAKQQALREKYEAQKEATIKREAQVSKSINKTIDAYKADKLELTTTDSGLKYIVHEAGKGAKINDGDQAYVMYYGSLLDKTSFDNSFKRGMPFPVQVGAGRVIKGWDEALAKLNKGDKATLFIPSDLAYGDADKPGIPGGSELVFYIEVMED